MNDRLYVKNMIPTSRKFRGGQSGVELWNLILKSLIKVGCPKRFKSFLSDFLQVESPCFCGHFEMRLTCVRPLDPEL